MKIVTYLDQENRERLGLNINGNYADVEKSGQEYSLELPNNILELLYGGEAMMDRTRELEIKLSRDGFEGANIKKLLAPVPHPPSCRDAYAFRQHVAAARLNRGVEMIAEFDQYPIFYFTNHNSIIGEGELVLEKDHFEKFDFELELAAIIGKHGKNIESKDGDKYIAGYTIMNDLSARLLQMEEMKLNLGPAKGKDFATAIGPWLATPDELMDKKIETEYGNQYDLRMTARHNGELVSDGNAKDMTWTFAEIIERVSYGVEIFPGDVIGSGTVGTGCYLELNGTRTRLAKEMGEDYNPVWLQSGDEMELEIAGLGVLRNKFLMSNNNISILAKKKI